MLKSLYKYIFVRHYVYVTNRYGFTTISKVKHPNICPMAKEWYHKSYRTCFLLPDGRTDTGGNWRCYKPNDYVHPEIRCNIGDSQIKSFK